MKTIKACLAVSVVIIMAATICFADGYKCDSVGAAEEYWAHGEQVRAKDCIEEVISKEPGNTRAYFMKGCFCLAEGNYPCATTKFQAPDVRARYGNEIAKAYEAEAEKKLVANDANKALELYRGMAGYNSTLSKTVAAELAKKGKTLNLEQFLNIAVQLDPGLGPEIAEHFANLADRAKNNEANRVEYLRLSSQYDSAKYQETYQKNNDNLGQMYLTKAKENARKVGHEVEMEKYKRLAIKYLGNEIVSKHLPDAIVYLPRSDGYTFSLKSGEQTDHWIMFSGQEYSISSKDYQYKLVYDDKSEVKDGPSVIYPKKMQAKFRIVALTDQSEIKMVIK
jgi:hypothetical protein